MVLRQVQEIYGAIFEGFWIWIFDFLLRFPVCIYFIAGECLTHTNCFFTCNANIPEAPKAEVSGNYIYYF